MNREPQIVDLATDDEIQRIDRRTIEEGVTVARGTVVLRDHVLPTAPIDPIVVITEPAIEGVVA